MGAWRRFLLALAAAAALSSLAASVAEGRPPPGRALFVRDEKLVRSSAQATGLLDFCTARTVRLLLVSVSDPPEDHAQQWAEFLSRAHSRGLKVHALGGQPEWGLGGESGGAAGGRFQPRQPFEHLNGILAYNVPRHSEKRFDGLLHEIDVWATERYQHADQAQKHDILSFYIEILRGCRRAAGRFGQPLDYGAVIPPDAESEVSRAWTDESKRRHQYTGPAYTHVISVVDYVVVRDHADVADRLIDAARDEMRAASSLGAAGYIAVQTAPPNGVPPTATFGDESQTAMEGALGTVVAAFREDKGFMGIAIDCYRTYSALKP